MTTERAYFSLCRALGWVLRSARYSRVRTAELGGEREVRKQRRFYAPLLVWLGVPLVRILDTGVRILPQRAWEERERSVYKSLRGTPIRVDAGGTLVLPCLGGRTLADLLADAQTPESVWTCAIEYAVVALARLHQKGFTHGDAMAENVLVDLDAGVAHWFDFETLHDDRRPLDWRRADDVRALLATCLLRAGRQRRAEILRLVLDGYGDEAVARLVAANFDSAWRRPLAFHLGQAGLSFESFQDVSRLLRAHLQL